MATPVPVPRPRAAPRALKPPVPKPRTLMKSDTPEITIIEPTAEDEVAEAMVPIPTPSHAAPSGKSYSVNLDNSCLRVDKPSRQVTKSLLLDFDPLLFNRRQEEVETIEESSEEAVGGHVYGILNKKPIALPEHIYDAVAQDEESSEEDDDEEPPPPPPRQDSIPREMWDNIPAARVGNSVMGGEAAAVERPEVTKRSTGINWAVRGLKSFIGEPKATSPPPALPLTCLRRPSELRPVHEGRLTNNGREKHRALVRLTTKNLSWLLDGAKKWTHWSLENCVLVAAVNNQGGPGLEVVNYEDHSYLSVTSWMAQTDDERDMWMCKIFQALTEESCLHEISSRLGWMYLKEGIGGTWQACWLALKSRCLHYLVPGQGMQQIDLRKSRCFEKEGDGDSFLADQPVFVVQMDTVSLYLQGIGPKVTELWRMAVKSSILKNGKALKEQQLTPANVVLIVDLCTNFVTTNGISSEGIYRKAGQSSKVAALLEALQIDPHEVVLTRNEYQEHEVGSALKRFFVNLPAPVLSEDLMHQLAAADEDWPQMGQLLRRELDTVAMATATKVFGHLHLISREHVRNKMDATNLATVWAVGLTHEARTDIPTLANIISHYPEVFGVDDAIMKREEKLLQMLEKLHAVTPQNTSSGDLRIWLTMGEATSTDTLQILLTPHKTAADVVAEAAASRPTWQLREVVLGGAMWRPLHPSEPVMEVVARWGYWSDEDRAHNKLVLGPCPFFEELRPLTIPPATTCGHFRVALPAARAYKDRFMQLQQGGITYSKMKGNVAQKLVEWPAKEFVWYNGYDPKRGPAGDRRWYVTLVPKMGMRAARSKEAPYFGITIAMEWRQDLLEWCASLTLAEHPNGLD